MSKLSVVTVVLALVAGCQSKKPSHEPSGEPAKPVATSNAWLERLAEVPSGATRLDLEMTAGLVAIRADGSVHVAKPPATAAADPRHLTIDPLASATLVRLDEVASALGLPAISPAPDAPASALATLSETTLPGDAELEPFARLGHLVPASGVPGVPTRATTAYGTIHEHDVSAGVIVFADAQAPATVLIDVLARTGGFVAVRRGTELGALSLAIDRHAPSAIAPNRTWVEVRLGDTIELESVPSAPRAVAAIEQLAEALSATPTPAVDVLVSPTTKVQDLVAAVLQLRAANVAAVGFGRTPAPGSPAAAARGDHGPRVIAWGVAPFDAQTGDAAAVRAGLERALEPLRTCYLGALASAADLAGDGKLALEQTRDGIVVREISGLPPALEACVTTALGRARAAGAGQPRAVARLGFAPR